MGEAEKREMLFGDGRIPGKTGDNTTIVRSPIVTDDV
jgi:hypothetical protein